MFLGDWFLWIVNYERDTSGFFRISLSSLIIYKPINTE